MTTDYIERFSEASVTLTRSCGHEDAILMDLDEDGMPPEILVDIAEHAMCSPCYSKWEKGQPVDDPPYEPGSPADDYYRMEAGTHVAIEAVITAVTDDGFAVKIGDQEVNIKREDLHQKIQPADVGEWVVYVP